MSNFGIVHLGDLLSRHRWDVPRIPSFLKAANLDTLSDNEISQISPPEVIIVVCHALDSEVAAKFQPWLSEASRVILVLSFLDTESALKDPKMLALIRTDFGDALEDVQLTDILLWSGMEQDTGVPKQAVSLAEGSVEEEPQKDLEQRPPLHLEPSTDWHSLGGVPCGEYQRVIPRLLARKENQLLFLDQSSAQIRCLSSGEVVRRVPPCSESSALLPGGNVLTEIAHAPPGEPFYFDYQARLGAQGHRCHFTWLYRGSKQIGVLSRSEHDWPCGHSKKQYGYLDNEPCRLQLSPNLDAYLSVFQKDAIISTALPIRWKIGRNFMTALTEPADDPERALFFQHDPEDGYSENPDDPFEDDARSLAPSIALGPSRNYQYSLGGRADLYRIHGEECSRVRFSGDYAIFDHKHNLVRSGIGRLLFGWGEYITLLKGEHLIREHVETGERRTLGRVDRVVDFALPISGSYNGVLVNVVDERNAKIRLV